MHISGFATFTERLHTLVYPSYTVFTLYEKVFKVDLHTHYLHMRLASTLQHFHQSVRLERSELVKGTVGLKLSRSVALMSAGNCLNAPLFSSHTKWGHYNDDERMKDRGGKKISEGRQRLRQWALSETKVRENRGDDELIMKGMMICSTGPQVHMSKIIILQDIVSPPLR